ncbi:hypothetical protein Aau02nite_21460 [Amorphoplanes auranticolor]|uniref:Hint domain-containing protein n=1 Tax=Actinoplanes auranticolor TaxID=47988 RepID=A0A919S5V6_9ACTN|nr:hypothetical protein Aau02nite_21460 [Actinoplanes auranticolor]
MASGFLVAPAPTPASAAARPAAVRDLPPISVPPLVTEVWDGRTGVHFPTDPRLRQLVADTAELHAEPTVRDAAAEALASDQPGAIMRFLNETQPRLEDEADQRRIDTARRNTTTIRAMAGTGVPGGYFNTEVDRVLRGTDTDRALFLAYGADIARGRDTAAAATETDRRRVLRERLTLLIAAAPAESTMKRTATAALAGDDAGVAAFWNTGYLAAATADATAREQYLADLEARNKAAEDLSDLAQRAARASEARRHLLIAHGNAVRELQRTANAMAGAANAARSAERILAGTSTTKTAELNAAKTATTTELTAAQQAAQRAQAAAIAAQAAADTLIDTGLTYGAEWTLIVQGMHQAATAAVGATQTAAHAVDATIATNNAQDAQARAEAHERQAVQWRLHAQEHAAAAKKLADAAKAQANAAKTAAARAKAARVAAQAAEARAWAAAERTRQQRVIAEAEAATARSARLVAEQERAKAAGHRAQAERQAAVAANARRNADQQAAVAAAAYQRAKASDAAALNAADTAWRQEGLAARARAAAEKAEREHQVEVAKHQALQTWAAATPAGEAKDEAQRRADQAKRDADAAGAAARNARKAAHTATGAAATARSAATEANRSAERAWAASQESRAAAARADAAAGRAEAEAKATHRARLQADEKAAAATAQEARAAEAANAAVRLAQQAADESVQALWAAQRTQAEAEAATMESVAAAAQAEIAVTAAVAARASSAGIAQPHNAALAMVHPFTSADIDADFVAAVAEQARVIGAEQAAAATARAREALAAAEAAADAADNATGQVKIAFTAAAEAARSASDAAASAAEAKRAAADAAADGAAARSAAAGAARADAQAKADARGARNAANEAWKDAAIAGRSAADARSDADQAAAAARTAETDAAAANTAAAAAEQNASAAQRAADSAQAHADSAAEAAENALQHAIAAQVAADRAEKAERDRINLAMAQAAAGQPTPPTPDDILSVLSEEEQQLYREAEAINGMSLMDFLIQELGELFWELSGLGNIHACIVEGDLLACLWTLVELLPWGRIWNAVEKLIKFAPRLYTFITKSQEAAKTLAGLLKRADELRDCRNSFLPGTPVLLADGRAVPIEDIRPGDHVLATDPVANLTRPEPVIRLLRDTGEKNLVDITVDTDGDRGDATSTITATGSHRFWSPESRRWWPAEQLETDKLLLDDSGRSVRITAVRERVATATVHNLWVARIHTFFVLAGGTSMLVHNCDDIALGLRDPDEGLSLADFAEQVGGAMYTDWPSGIDYWMRDFRGFLKDGKTKIHFNLDGIDDWREWSRQGAEESDPDLGYLMTAWELNQVLTNESAKSRTTFYRNGKACKLEGSPSC